MGYDTAGDEGRRLDVGVLLGDGADGVEVRLANNAIFFLSEARRVRMLATTIER